MSWDLSRIYNHQQSKLIDDNRIVSTSSNNSLIIIRDTITLQSLHSISNPSASPPKDPTAANQHYPPILSINRNQVVATNNSSNTIIFVHDPLHSNTATKLQINDYASFEWLPLSTSNTLLVNSNHHLNLSIYQLSATSLSSSTVASNPILQINNPKLNYPQGASLQPRTALFLAIVERHQSRDLIGIYDTVNWKLLRHFHLPLPTSDVADIAWSPCGNYIAIWETMTDYILHIYTPDGRLQKTFTPYASLSSTPVPSKPVLLSRSSGSTSRAPEPSTHAVLTDREKAREEKSTDSWVGLGVRVVRWHPTGDWIAIGGWDSKIRILCKSNWATIVELSHPAKITSPSATIWKEPVDWIEPSRGKSIVSFELESLPFSPKLARSEMGKANPKMGVSELTWSPSGRWLASYNQSFPTLLWIYSFAPSSSTLYSEANLNDQPLLHTVLVFTLPVKSFAWSPSASSDDVRTGSEANDERESMAIATGEKAFLIWREPLEGSVVEARGMAEGVGIPTAASFTVTSLGFASNGSALLLADQSSFALAYPAVDEPSVRVYDDDDLSQ